MNLLERMQIQLRTYDEWSAERTALSEADASGDSPSSSRWECSDDNGTEGYHDLSSTLQEIVDSVPGVLEAAQEAQDASLGDSNDSEIDLLRNALETALGALGLELPEARDEEED